MPRPRHAIHRRSVRTRLGRGTSWLLATGLLVAIAGPTLMLSAVGDMSYRASVAATATAQPALSSDRMDVTVVALAGMVSLTAVLMLLSLLPARARRPRVFHQAEPSTGRDDSDDETRGTARTSPMGVAVKLALFMTLVIALRVVIGIRGVRR